MTRRALTLLVLTFSFLFAGASYGELSFTQPKLTFQLTPATDFNVSLRSLLVTDPGIPLTWTTSAARPTFFGFSASEERFTARPTEADFGRYTFRLTVKNPATDDGAIAEVEVVVSDAPRWARIPLPLGVQVVGGQSLSVDLRKEIQNPQPDLSFAAQGLRDWMRLTPEGLLTGTPTANDVGDYAGITFTATTSRGASQNTAFGAVVREDAKLTLLGSKWLPLNQCRKITVSQDDGTGNPLIFGFDRQINLALTGTVAQTSRIFVSETCAAPSTDKVVVPAGRSRVDVFLRATVEGDVTLTASSAPLKPASMALFAIPEDSILSLAMTITNGSERSLTRTCVAVDLKMKNGAGAAFPAPFDTAVALSSDSTQYRFYSDAACAQNINQVMFARGAQAVKIYVTSQAADGVKLLRASATDYETAEIPYQFVDRSAVKLKLTLSKNQLIEGQCVTASVRAMHALDGDAEILQALPVDLSATGDTASTGSFYSDAACATSTNQVSIRPGSATVSFSFKFALAGAAVVKAATAVPGISGDQAAVTVSQPPKFALVPVSGLDFGELLVGQSKEMVAILNNTGSPAPIGTINVSGAGFTLLPTTACLTGQTLATNAGCEIRVRFTAPAEGAKLGTLTVVAPTEDLTISLRGSGAPARFTLTPPTLDYGDLAVGASKDLVATLTNTGSPGSIGAIAIAGDSAKDFVVSPTSTCVTGQNLANNASCDVRVRFMPSTAGTKNAALSVVSPNATLTVNLRGAAVPPKFAIAPAGGLNFGELVVGQSKELPAILSNSGAASAIGAVTVSGDGFSLSPNTACQAGQTINTNGGCEIRVRFTANTQGAKAGSLTVATAMGALSISLTGSGAPSRFALIPAAGLDFGEVPLGVAKDLVATLTNSGSPGAIGAIAAGGEFSIVGGTCQPGQQLAMNGSCQITVRFVPAAAGARSGSLTVGSPSGNTSIALRGSGLPPRFVLTPAAGIDFGGMLVGSSRDLNAVLTNTGATAPIGPIAISGGEFVISSSVCQTGQNLATGASCPITVRFTPASEGVKAGSLSVSSANGLLTIALRGAGQAPGQIAFNPSGSLDLGHLMVPNTSTACIQAVQTGGLPVQITGFGTTPASVMRLDNAAGCGVAACQNGMTLNAGQSCSIRVRFVPGSAGAFQEQLVMTWNSSGQAGSVGLWLRGSASVPPPAPQVWIQANGTPTLLKAYVMDNVSISWGSANATSCSMTQNDLAARYVRSTAGNVGGGNWAGPTLYDLNNPGYWAFGNTDPAWRDVTYTLTCTGAGGQASAAVRVRRWALGAGGPDQVSYILGSLEEAQACAVKIRSAVKLDPECGLGRWGSLWADGNRNPWWIKPVTAPGQGKWCTCFNPKTAPAGKPWAKQYSAP